MRRGRNGHLLRAAMLKILETDTLQIACEESGHPGSRPVVLLHGFPEDPKAWGKVGDELARDGFRTIAPYLRGFGPTRFLRSETPSRSKIRLVHKKDGCVSLPSRRFYASLLPSIRGFA